MPTTDRAVSLMDAQLLDRLLDHRIVILGSEVTEEAAHRICSQLLLLSALDPAADIHLYINSPGGSVTAGLAVYDTMQLVPNDVATLAMGFAASMGQFLLTGGARGKRSVLPHARVVMHQPHGGIGGTAIDMQIQAESMKHFKDLMHRLNAENSGQDLATITADADRDRWFTADDAVRYGLADRVVTGVGGLG